MLTPKQRRGLVTNPNDFAQIGDCRSSGINRY